jgi:Tfp pilus assembly protein PilV
MFIGRWIERGGHRGFSLIEAMIGITLLSISLLGVVGMMAYFGFQNSDKMLRNCLLDNASNALTQYRNQALPINNSNFACGNNVNGTVAMNFTVFPASNVCNDVTATATGGGRSVMLQSKVCNFQ